MRPSNDLWPIPGRTTRLFKKSAPSRSPSLFVTTYCCVNGPESASQEEGRGSRGAAGRLLCALARQPAACAFQQKRGPHTNMTPRDCLPELSKGASDSLTSSLAGWLVTTSPADHFHVSSLRGQISCRAVRSFVAQDSSRFLSSVKHENSPAKRPAQAHQEPSDINWRPVRERPPSAFQSPGALNFCMLATCARRWLIKFSVPF